MDMVQWCNACGVILEGKEAKLKFCVHCGEKLDKTILLNLSNISLEASIQDGNSDMFQDINFVEIEEGNFNV